MRSVVVGGGIAGCAIAAALRGTPLSRESVILEGGQPGARPDAGILLSPAGLRALASIAPEFDWTGVGRVVDTVSLRSRAGRVFFERPFEPCLAISQRDFMAMLREAARTAGFLGGWTMGGLDTDPDGRVRAVRLADGGSLRGDAFFACDGARSRAREVLFPQCALGPAVVEEIVTVVDAPEIASELSGSLRKYHDENGGLAIEIVATSALRVAFTLQFDPSRWRLGSDSPAALCAFLGETIADWAPEVLSLVGRIDFGRCQRHQAREISPPAALSSGNLVFVGDAAHGALPFTGRGTNDALIDAALLGNLLATARSPDDVRESFARYSELREPQRRRALQDDVALRSAFLEPLGCGGPRLPVVA